MSGHVDGVGVVTRMEPARDDAGSMLLEVEVPRTARAVHRDQRLDRRGRREPHAERRRRPAFCVNLIPHTLAVTTLRHLAVGGEVNLEIDVLARYVVEAVHQQLQGILPS